MTKKVIHVYQLQCFLKRSFGPSQNDQKRIDTDLTPSKNDKGEEHIAGSLQEVVLLLSDKIFFFKTFFFATANSHITVHQVGNALCQKIA